MFTVLPGVGGRGYSRGSLKEFRANVGGHGLAPVKLAFDPYDGPGRRFVPNLGRSWVSVSEADIRPSRRPPYFLAHLPNFSNLFIRLFGFVAKHYPLDGAAAFLGRISPMRRICAPTPRSFSSMCS